jgi:molybdopterin-guanine dinucleotide biosynthesis protein A
VVAAPNQKLPELSDDVVVVRDRREFRGPLAGIYGGLDALTGRADAAYATACDVPMLVPAFVQHLCSLLGENDDVVVPVEGSFHHPLAAIYRTRITETIEQLLSQDRLRPVHLYEKVTIRRVPVQSLKIVDPGLLTLRNVNTPEEYEEVLRLAGLS